MINGKLQRLKEKNLFRKRMVTPLNKNYCDFSSSDYLGLSTHPKIALAYQNAITNYGFGSLASPVISGYYDCHRILEEKICESLNTEKAILLNAGYLANLATLSCITDKKQIVLTDKSCHISILQGIKLAGAKSYRYQHNNMTHLALLIKKHNPGLIVSQTVFSMDGDKTDVNNIAKLANINNSTLLVDDAHGFGWLNTQSPRSAIFTLSLSKTLASMGGAIAGTREHIEYILQFGKAYQYSTSLSPVVACGVITTLEVIKTELWRKHKLFENIDFFNQKTKNFDLPLISLDITPIKSILIKDIDKTLQLQRTLINNGYLVSAIRPPSVTPNSSRLRITLSSKHSKYEIENLLKIISDANNDI